jgi:hypothetical protein
MITLIVREWFAKTPQRIQDLPIEEVNRLTSRSNWPEQNLLIEFEIEKGLYEIWQQLGIHFSTTTSWIDGKYHKLTKKWLLRNEEEKMINNLKLPIPTTRKLIDLEKDNVSYPFIIKDPESRRWRNVYFIEDNEMLETFLSFLDSSSATISWKKIEYNASDLKKRLLYQEYIETPSECFTSYRVMVSCTWSVMTSTLLYSGNKKYQKEFTSKENNITDFTDLLIIENSPYYLRSQRVTSNVSGWGSDIVLNPLPQSKKTNSYEQGLLWQHWLDTSYPEVPQLLIKASVEIANYLNEIWEGLIYGIDRIQDKQGRYYYLETNITPSTWPYQAKYSEGKWYKETILHLYRKTLEELSIKQK